MPLPASVPVGTVTGRYYEPDGDNAIGTAHFLLLSEIEVPDDPDGVVIPLITKVSITAGVLNVTLPAGFYNARVKLGDWYEKAITIEVEEGVALNLPDAVGVVPPEELVTPVRSVDGYFPDASGNIDLPGGGGGGVTDHGDLTGLADDDHSQYHNDARGDARYYTKTQIDTTLTGYATDAELTTGLAGKSDTGHTHIISNVTGLQTALDGKADDSQITDIDGRLDALEGFHATFPIEVLGLVAANENPSSFRDNSAMGTNGWFVTIYVRPNRAITGCLVGVHGAGTIDAGGENGFAIYDATGALIGSTASDNTLFTSQGIRSKALTTPIAAQATGRIVYVELRREGYSVEPQYAFLQTANSAGLSDGGWPSGIRRSFVAGGTGHPASINPATHGSSSSGYMPFVGLY